MFQWLVQKFSRNRLRRQGCVPGSLVLFQKCLRQRKKFAGQVHAESGPLAVSYCYERCLPKASCWDKRPGGGRGGDRLCQVHQHRAVVLSPGQVDHCLRQGSVELRVRLLHGHSDGRSRLQLQLVLLCVAKGGDAAGELGEEDAGGGGGVLPLQAEPEKDLLHGGEAVQAAAPLPHQALGKRRRPGQPRPRVGVEGVYQVQHTGGQLKYAFPPPVFFTFVLQVVLLQGRIQGGRAGLQDPVPL